MDRRQKKRKRNSMSPEEKDKMHVKARNNIKKLHLVMSPEKKAEMNMKANNGMKNLQLIMSPKKGRNEHEIMQQDEEYTHDYKKRQKRM